MTNSDIETIRKILMGPKSATSAAGTIVDRDAADLEKAVKLLKRLNDETEKRANVERIGIYGRRYD